MSERPAIKVKCIECGKVDWIPLKDYGRLGPACAECMGIVVTVGAKS